MPGPDAAPALTVGGAAIARGRKVFVDVPVSRLALGSPIAMPVCVVRGRRDGPGLFLTAAIHGDELNGVAIVRHVLANLDPRRLRGHVIAVPVVNVFGFLQQMRTLPDRRDLNRSFPGSPRGSLAARLARLLLDEVVERCDVGVDLHTAALHRDNLPQIRADLDDPETERLARAFAPPVLVDARVRDGSLREAATKRGRRVLLYEAGEALRLSPEAIAAGVRGVRRVLAALDMLDPPPDEAPAPEPLVARESTWVRAGASGLLELTCELGTHVESGQVLGEVTDAFGRRLGRVRASRTGLVMGRSTNALVHRGDALVHIAVVGSGQASPSSP